jgi:hypothetical protein
MANSRKQRYFELAILLICMLLFPVLGTFWHHQYPLASPEFFLMILAATLLAATLAAVLVSARSLIVNFSLVLLTIIIFMIQFNLLLEGMALTLLAAGVIAVTSGRAFPKLMIPVVLALILGAYLDNWSDRAANKAIADIEQPDPSLPPIVHIILDQFIGLDGLPPEQPAQLFRTTALEFLKNNDFQVYPRAYSNYLNSEDSLDRAFNFNNGDQRMLEFDLLLLKNFDFESNAYLESIQELGYAVRIYQSEGMGFCNSMATKPEKCWTYNIPDLVSIHHGYENPLERMHMILRIMVSQSWLLNMMAERKGWARPGGFSYFKPEIFDEMSADMMTQANGRMYFAHLLLPHSPYVYLGDCSLNYGGEKQWRFSSYSSSPNNTPHSRGNRYILYLQQARCALKQLDGFFDDLRKYGIFDQSIILMHGDHGSTIYERLPSIANETMLTGNDYLDAFSTFYAVKMPNDRFQIHPESVSLSVLIDQFASELTGKSHPELDNRPFIYLRGQTTLKRKDIDIFSK